MLDPTELDSPWLVATSVTYVGTRTITRLPQTAPGSVPRPPITAAVSSAIESVIVNAPGATSPVTIASRPPPSPAQAPRPTNASPGAAATFGPASAAATSSSRTARQLR